MHGPTTREANSRAQQIRDPFGLCSPTDGPNKWPFVRLLPNSASVRRSVGLPRAATDSYLLSGHPSRLASGGLHASRWPRSGAGSGGKARPTNQRCRGATLSGRIVLPKTVRKTSHVWRCLSITTCLFVIASTVTENYPRQSSRVLLGVVVF